MLFEKPKVLTPVLIFFISFFLRWYGISDYLFFGYEQGRDALIIQKIYQFKDFVLVGPSTSIGGLFHGPWFYYMMALSYGLSGGNPVAASFLLVILGSLVPVIIYFFACDIFKSRVWGLICSILAMFSFEYILYSRWLSNVSPAPLFVVLSFFVLWKYINTRKSKFFLWFTFFSSIASLFQMILIPQFLMVLVILAILKEFKLPSLKTILFSLPIILTLFSPIIIFDFRNEHITFNSLVNFSRESSGNDTWTLISGARVYLRELYQHIVLSVLYIKNLPIQIFLIVMIFAGTVWGYFKGNRKVAVFLLSWILMTIPLIKISPGNPQYYVGAGLGWILLFCFSMKSFWESKIFKMIPVTFIGLVLMSFCLTVNSLLKNKDIFFRTTQEDLVFSDQLALLKFINKDSMGEPYKLAAFTIPSLHPEGWDYLHSYYYPDARTLNAKIVYIAIEKEVFPVWEEKWINDLGETELVFEKKFGLLRLQKREIID